MHRGLTSTASARIPRMWCLLLKDLVWNVPHSELPWVMRLHFSFPHHSVKCLFMLEEQLNICQSWHVVLNTCNILNTVLNTHVTRKFAQEAREIRIKNIFRQSTFSQNLLLSVLTNGFCHVFVKLMNDSLLGELLLLPVTFNFLWLNNLDT